MLKSSIRAIFIAFALTMVMCHYAIPFLHRLKFGQQIREEGPKEHQKKAGTPTMGGIVFLITILVTGIFFLRSHRQILPILFMTAGFGLVGFVDDYIKIVMKRSEGFTPLQKFLAQFVITTIFCYYMLAKSGLGTSVLIPFSGGQMWKMPVWLYVPVLYVAVLGTDNGVNFSDGLDGLCSSVTIAVAAFFLVAGYKLGAETGPACGAVIGALMAFLVYNVYPAKVFMGDTGSLALGGFVVSTAYLLQMPIFILLVGFIYLVEVVSVILQVTYFKKTGGKRLFRMAPIHHHFELGGWSESRVVCVFTTVTVLMGLLSYMAM